MSDMPFNEMNLRTYSNVTFNECLNGKYRLEQNEGQLSKKESKILIRVFTLNFLDNFRDYHNTSN